MSNGNEQQIRQRVIARLERHYEDQLDEEGVDELNALLRESEAARDAYLSFTYLHGALAWRHGVETEDSADQAEGAPAALRLPNRIRRYMRRPEPLSIVIATVVMGLIISVTAYIAAPVFRSPGPASELDRPVAQLTGDHNAVWEGVALWRGSSLRVGQRIQIESGLVEITYLKGAQVLIEGPADYIVDGAETGGLDSGKVTAYVPAEAVGFSIGTPVGTAKDLGTSFGIHVKGKHDASFAVFDGKIEVQTKTRAGAKSITRVLTAGEAWHVTADGETYESENDVRESFTLRLPGAEGDLNISPEYVSAVEALRPVAYWRFEQIEEGSFRSESSPDFALRREGRVFPFGKADSNRVAAFRPDGVKSYLVGDTTLTARLNELGSDVTVIAWVKTSSPDHQAIVHQWSGGEAISLEIHDGRSAFVLKFSGQAKQVHLASSKSFAIGRWVMLAGVCDGREMRLYEDGEIRARVGIPEGAAINDDSGPLYLGHRSGGPGGQLFGGMDEVAIFDKALSQAEIRQIYELRRTHE